MIGELNLHTRTHFFFIAVDVELNIFSLTFPQSINLKKITAKPAGTNCCECIHRHYRLTSMQVCRVIKQASVPDVNLVVTTMAILWYFQPGVGLFFSFYHFLGIHHGSHFCRCCWALAKFHCFLVGRVLCFSFSLLLFGLSGRIKANLASLNSLKAPFVPSTFKFFSIEEHFANGLHCIITGFSPTEYFVSFHIPLKLWKRLTIFNCPIPPPTTTTITTTTLLLLRHWCLRLLF